MANEESAEKNCPGCEPGINLTADDIYVAPVYGKTRK